jgi:hypothetical protein
MKIKYIKLDDAAPPLTPIKPQISEGERRLAKLPKPPALPIHCKPWIDAQSYGLLMLFPHRVHLTITGQKNDIPKFSIKSTTGQRGDKSIVSMFSLGHFGLATNYLIRTEPGVGIYTQSLPAEYQSTAYLVNGLVETWWYPKPLFLVFTCPRPKEIITFQYGDPLCVLMPILCGKILIEEMTGNERKKVMQERRSYEEYLAHHPELRWTSAEGNGFSTQYKLFSKINCFAQKSGK